MDLEQRVKTLEYEIKILKNEIQRTLLDIQEQVLVHYYPTLRSEDSAPPKSAVAAVEATRAPVVESEPTPAAPLIKQVSLEEARNLARNASTAAAPVAVASPAVPGTFDMSKLLQWALDGAAKIGSERLDSLVAAFVQKGVLTPDMQQVLARIAPLNRRAAPATVAVGDTIRVVMELDAILGRPADVEEALTWMEEAKIG